MLLKHQYIRTQGGFTKADELDIEWDCEAYNVPCSTDGYTSHVTIKASRKSSSVFYPPLQCLFHVFASMYRRWACWGDMACFRLCMSFSLHAMGAYFLMILVAVMRSCSCMI
jgi:hypothetical protein